MKLLKVLGLNILLFALVLLALAIARRIEALLGITAFQSSLWMIVGALCVVFGMSIRSWAAVAFYNHQLRFMELRRQHTLLQTGPFALSRNPIYVGVVAIILGCALLLGSPVGMLCALLSFISWHVWVQRFEEPSLEAAFGGEYRQYMQRVPRWLGPSGKSAPAIRTATPQ